MELDKNRERPNAEWALTKTEINHVSVFRVFDLLFIHIKPYENEFSTALSECKAVARCATRKTDTTINRIKTVGVCETVHREIHTVWTLKTFVALKLCIENTYNRKQNKNRWGLQTVDPLGKQIHR